jgi:Flp pilus assembly pilin Flp
MKKQAQSLIEYGLILALVAVVAVVILGKFSSSITNVGNKASGAVTAAGDNAMNNYCKTVDNPTGGKYTAYDSTTGGCK